MLLPIGVQGIHSGLFFLAVELFLKRAQLMENTVMGNTADAGHTAKANRQKIQTSGQQIIVFNAPKQSWENGTQAAYFTLCLIQSCTGFMRLCICLHDRQLFLW